LRWFMKKYSLYFAFLALSAFFAVLASCGSGEIVDLSGSSPEWNEIIDIADNLTDQGGFIDRCKGSQKEECTVPIIPISSSEPEEPSSSSEGDDDHPRVSSSSDDVTEPGTGTSSSSNDVTYSSSSTGGSITQSSSSTGSTTQSSSSTGSTTQSSSSTGSATQSSSSQGTSGASSSSNTLTCTTVPATGTAGTPITPPTVRCNNNNVNNPAFSGAPTWNNPTANTYTVSVNGAGACVGKSTSCGTIVVSAAASTSSSSSTGSTTQSSSSTGGGGNGTCNFQASWCPGVSNITWNTVPTTVATGCYYIENFTVFQRNSWTTGTVKVNGVDATASIDLQNNADHRNKYPKVDGGYYIYYSETVSSNNVSIQGATLGSKPACAN
jgi:hypothetical protein